MDITNVIVALITAAGALIGSLYGSKKASSLTDYKIEELTREVREHNGFAKRMPVLENCVENIGKKVDKLEKRVDDLEKGE